MFADRIPSSLACTPGSLGSKVARNLIESLSLHTFVVCIAANHLLLLVVLFVHVVAVIEVLLLFDVLHLLHGAAVLSLLIHGLHVVPRRQHLVTAHSTRACVHRPLLALTFAFLPSALVQGSVQLYKLRHNKLSVIRDSFADQAF